jgi:hypothetical protein
LQGGLFTPWDELRGVGLNREGRSPFFLFLLLAWRLGLIVSRRPLCAFSQGVFMRWMMSRRVLGAAAVMVVLGGAVVLSVRKSQAEVGPDPDPAAIDRTRTTVRMLDDVYKGFVVHITETYVKAQETTPAARVTQKVFKHMEKNRWHSARLVDATGEPANRKNAPKTDFERRAIEELKSGKTYFDEVGQRDNRPVLRAATPVPVVMKQCIACHPGLKEGQLMGAIVYEVPIR